MEITVNREALARAFGHAASVAPTRSTKEVLNGIKFIATPGGLTLNATDMETGVSMTVEGVDVAKAGMALLPVGRMGAILRESSDEQLTIATTDVAVVVSGARSQFKLPSQDPLEYPSIQAGEFDNYTVFNSERLAEAIKRTAFATDPDSTRFALGGLLMGMQGPDSYMVGTDGRRLAKVVIEGNAVGDVKDYASIVPTRAANVLQRLLPDDCDIKLAFTNNACRVQADGFEFYSRLVEGRFPNWKQVIPSPEAWPVDIEIPVGPFASMVRQAAIVADHETRGVDFTFSGGTMQLAAKTAETGTSRVEMPIAYDGAAVTIRLDYRYLSEFLKALDSSSSCRLRAVDGKQAALLATDDGYAYVVMPMAGD